MDMPSWPASAEAWLAWFEQYKAVQVRTALCRRYGLNALDAAALLNMAQLQVCRHWAALTNPLAYLWQTLTHAVGKQAQRQRRERQQLAAYAQEQQRHVHSAARADTQVAAWLQTTPQAVRVARHGAYRALRAQLAPARAHPPHP